PSVAARAAAPNTRARRSLVVTATTRPSNQARLNRTIMRPSSLLVVLASEEPRDAQRTATAILLLFLVARSRVRSRQVGHSLEQGAAAGRRCSGTAALRRRRSLGYRFLGLARSSEHATAAARSARLDRFVRFRQTTRIQQQLVLRCSRLFGFVIAGGTISLESQFERIAFFALSTFIPGFAWFLHGRRFGVALDARAAQGSVAVAAVLAEFVVLRRLCQTFFFLALVARFVRRRSA